MLFDDAKHRGQTEAGAFADALGGEKGLKNMAAHLGRHAGTGVGNGKTNKGAGNRFRMQLEIVLRKRRDACGDR